MEHKIALITGASDGIGKQVALELTQMGYSVIIHGRNQKKLILVRDEILAKTGKSPDMVIADLASFDHIRKMSDELHSKYDKIDLLVNNAGVQMHEKELSDDGYEKTFAINHLAYFLVISLFLDLVRKSQHKRIVLVSSHIHSKEIDFDNLQGEREFSLYPNYGVSKLCNLLFGYKLARMLEPEGITVNCVHPGMVDTNLNPRRPAEVAARAIPVEKGSISTIYAATSKDLDGVTGKYFLQDGTEAKSQEISYDLSIQNKLWELSENLIGEKFRF